MGDNDKDEKVLDNEAKNEEPKKKKRSKKSKSATSPVEVDSIESPEQPEQQEKPKKKTTKKKTNGTKQKKEGTKTRKSKVKSDNKETELSGQSELGQVKVDVLSKQILPSPGSSSKAVQVGGKNIDLVPEAADLKGASVQLGPVLSGTASVETVQEATLPFRAIKVRNVVGKVVNLVAEVIPNKVIVQGVVHEQLFFVGTDDLVHHISDDVNFSTFLDIPGAMPGMNAQVTANIEEIIPELAPDGLSVVKKIILEVFVKVTETVQVNFLPGNGPLLLLKQVVGENTVQTLVETDFTLPVPAIKVDEVVGRIENIDVEVIENKVIIQGVLHKQIFFIDTNNVGRHQAEDVPFSTFVDLPGAVPGMDVQVHPRIEVILFELISPTILRQKAVMEFFVKVTETVRQNVTVGDGPLFKVEEFIGENKVQELSETVITLDVPAVKVREIIARIQDIESFVITDKVIVQGILHKQIFFIGTDNIERHQAEDIPFSLFLDIPGAVTGDNVHIQPIIEAVFFELLSPTQLRQKVVFAIHAVVAREIQLNLVLSTGPLFKVEQVIGENTKQVLVIRREPIVPPPPVSPITIDTVTIVFPEAVAGEQQIIIRNELELPVTAIKIKEIQAIITDLSATIVTDGVLVQGVVEKTVFFVDTDNIVRTVTEEVPFSILVNIPGIQPGTPINVTVDIETITFSLSEDGERVIQNIVLRATVQGESAPGQRVTVVTNVSGPGIVQSKVRVRAFVLLPNGQIELQEFDVVTDVSGPGIGNVTRQVLLLDVVNDGNPNPVPVQVVTDVEIL